MVQPTELPSKADFLLNFRKRTLYAFVTMGLLGNLSNLIGGFFGTGLSSETAFIRLLSNILLVVMWVAVLILALRNKVLWAGLLFCIFGTVLITVSLFTVGGEFYVPTLYVLVIVVAATFTTPTATIIFGFLTTGAYIAASSWSISRLPPPVSPDKGANVAILAIVMVASTGLLWGFSSGLGRLVRSVSQQAEELGQLNRTLQRQRQIQAQLARQITQLIGALGQILREQNNASQVQATLVSNMAVTTQELDATARKIADSALSVATVAEKAQKSVEFGNQTATLGVTAIAAMRQRVQDINDTMHTLDQQIERISEVTAIIGEIADETNLLALNANIEAAGAKEYGRRFAAVADEVQRLSRRATAAVEQIQDMVLEINQASGAALKATEQGLREAEVGDRVVGSMTAANDEVGQLVAQTSNLASNIAEATKQQREASSQIVEVMQQIIAATNRLLEAGGEVSGLVGTLETASEQLTQTERIGTAPRPSLSTLVASLPPGETPAPPVVIKHAKSGRV